MKKSVIIKLTAIVLAFVLFGGMNPVFSEDYGDYGLIIDDTFINKEITTTTLEGITYVPLSGISDSLGVKILQEAEKITIIRQKSSVMLEVKQGKVYFRGKGNTEELQGYINNSTVYISVLLLADYLGFNIEVLNEIKFIRINTKPNALMAGQLQDRYYNPNGTDKRTAASEDSKGKGSKIAYLTFDDGLDSKVTPQVLDILKQYNVKGTFFIIGNTINKNKEILKRITAEGHTIGNHTYTHKKEIIYSSAENLYEEVEKTSKAVYDTVGITPKLFRPPYGAPYIRSQEYKDVLSDYKIVLWNIDSMDSRIKGIDSNEIEAAVISQLQNKSDVTILFHNTSAREETAKALPGIIQYLIDSGYTISILE